MKFCYMTKEEEKEYFVLNRDDNLRYIHSILPSVTPRELGLIASFISGLCGIGRPESEYSRDVVSK